MGIDRRGLIAVVENAPFQNEYRPMLENVRLRLRPQIFPLIHSIYVYGSVASGRAISGCSDLDLSLVLRNPPSNRASIVIEEIRQEIEAAYPIASKVDFDIGVLQDILSAETGVAWRYWLKHHCRCIAGDDLAEGIPLFRPSRTLALAVNGDFEQVLQRYQSRLAIAQPEAVVRRLVKEAARKLIRSTNVLRKETDPDWPETLEEYLTRFQRLFPAHGDRLLYFYEQAFTPDAALEDFSRRLQAFSGWMARIVGENAQWP